jgi:thymidylate synthase (FAD)
MDIMKKWVPLTYDAFIMHRMNGFSLSSTGVEFVKSLIKNKKFDKTSISKRELNEITKRFDLA